MMPSTLSQLFGQGSVEIVTNLDIQDRDVPPCPSHDAYGLERQASRAERKDIRAAKRYQTITART